MKYLLLTLLLASCARGPAGLNGSPGTDGANGQDGANAEYELPPELDGRLRLIEARLDTVEFIQLGLARDIREHDCKNNGKGKGKD